VSARRNTRRLLLVGAGAVAARAGLWAATRTRAAGELNRANFRGRGVSLAGGPALAAAASITAALGAGGPAAGAAALTAGLGSGAVGRYDDVVGDRPQHQAKGFRGHLSALREGRVTSGLIKIVGVGAAGLAASALLSADRRRLRGTRTAGAGSRRVGSAATGPGRTGPAALADTLLGAAVIAGSANLFNLLDLRPGRALKAALLVGGPLVPGTVGGLVAGPVGAAAALLPEDLDEQIMLGDAGANALGALVGVGLAARTGPLGRAGVFAAVAALTAASEKVSFTKVIASTPGLRELDALGRRTD
jgi:hypothetical protein